MHILKSTRDSDDDDDATIIENYKNAITPQNMHGIC